MGQNIQFAGQKDPKTVQGEVVRMAGPWHKKDRVEQGGGGKVVAPCQSDANTVEDNSTTGGRTAAQCLERYESLLDAATRVGMSPEEAVATKHGVPRGGQKLRPGEVETASIRSKLRL